MGRTIELERLDEIFQTSDRAVISAVAGMGGLGKTQLAVQYARRNQAKFPGGVCWLNGQTGDLATQVILKAEFDLKLKGLDRAKEQLIETDAISLWCWRHWQPDGRVLIVVDDVTDWGKVRSILPTDDRFRVLVTTRRQDLLAKPVTIVLDVLEPGEARSLLAKLEGEGRVERDQETADLLCAALGYLPLGIELVGCYLRRDRYRTLSQIIESLREKGMQDPALVRSDEDNLVAELGVKAAFDLTWEALEPGARKVARLLSYFALDWIWWDIVEWMMQRVEGETYELGELKARLENASLVKFEQNLLGWCRLHPLVRQYLKEEESIVVRDEEDAPLRSAFVSEIILIASDMPQNPSTSKIRWFEPVRSHVQEVAEFYSTELDGKNLVCTFVALARFYHGQGLYPKEEEWYTKCLQFTTSFFNGDHADIAVSLNNLAGFYLSQGQLSKAESLYVESLEMTQRLFTDDHCDVAQSFNNLAALYVSQGQSSKAEPLYVKSLEMYQRIFAGDHLEIAVILNNLAGFYESQRQFSKAESLHLKSLEMRRRLFVDDHPMIALSLNNLSVFYSRHKQLREAELLCLESLEMRQRLFVGNHPDTAQSLNNLAGICESQGQLSKAELLYVQAAEMFTKTLGVNHPDTQIVRKNIEIFHQRLHSAPAQSVPVHPMRRFLRWLRRQVRKWMRAIWRS